MPRLYESFARSIRLLALIAMVGVALAIGAKPAPAAEGPKIARVQLGLGGAYKLGFWAPLRVTVEGGDQPAAVNLMAIAPDSDGVGVATTAPGGKPVSAEPGRTSEQTLYVRVGQDGAPIEVRLLVDGKRVDRRLFEVDYSDEEVESGQAIGEAVYATARMRLELGPDVGLGEALSDENNYGWYSALMTRVERLEQLPRDAIGYDGFDTILLTAGRRAGGQGGDWLGGLTNDDPRVAALIEWVESGGRLVFSCGSGADALLAPGAPLAELAPGDCTGSETLRLVSAIEGYAMVESGDDDQAIDLTEGGLAVARLDNIVGRVEARSGRGDSQLPLIVRSARGFGEITFVAFDLDAPPIAAWSGRKELVRKLVGVSSRAQGDDWSPYGGRGDLLEDLIYQLDSRFTGVTTPPFLAVVGLVIVYLGLIGPGDYWLVTRVLKRPEATWITFPLIVVATSAAAYLGSYWLKGDQLRINQIEVVDVDCASGDARGMVLTHLFSPRAERYDLSLVANDPAGEPIKPEELSLAWLGRPGSGLGGTQRSHTLIGGGLRPDYTIDATPLLATSPSDALQRVPVQVWSTKTFLGRWRAQVGGLPLADLSPDGDGLIEGNLTNDTGTKLADCRLLYGDWAWRLGDLLNGQTATIDSAATGSAAPLKISSLLRENEQRNGEYSIETIAERLSIGASRSGGATQPASDYFPSNDLTHLLDLGHALLLARVEGDPRSQLERGGESLFDEQNNYWTFVRYVIDLKGGRRKAEGG